MVQSVLHLLEPLRLSPTSGRDTGFPARLYFSDAQTAIETHAQYRCWPQGKSVPCRQERLWKEWDVQRRL